MPFLRARRLKNGPNSSRIAVDARRGLRYPRNPLPQRRAASVNGQHRVLIVDLNNFARYPTIAIGDLTSILRQAGVEVQVFSPLSSGVTGVAREPRARPWSLVDQKLRYWSSVSSNALVQRA